MGDSRWFLVGLSLACSSPVPSSPATTKPGSVPQSAERHQSVQLRIRGESIAVEVVRTPEERRQGLMYRTSLAPNSGMLFVFEQEAIRPFWMKNTRLPLSIAFIDRDSIITDVMEMAPEDTTTRYSPSSPSRYALEMNAGWFQAHGIKPGDKVSGIPQ